MKTKNIIILFIIINLIICNDTKDEQNDSNYIDWGKNNNIVISPLIKISSVNGIKKFIALEDIESKTEILKIPYDITFNIQKVLLLINSDELKQQYEKFKKLDIPTYEPHHINLQKEEIFLSYIFYLIQHEPEMYNNIFYEKYKFYLSSFKYYLPRSPLFYSTEQIEYLSGTYLGKFHDRIKKLFQEEIKVLKNESYYNKDIDYKNYTYNRLFTQNKGLEISGHISMIPFLNYFDRDYVRNNAKFFIDINRDIKITTKNKIKKGETIIVNSPKRTNVERMIFEGELNNYIVNYKENYIIPAFSPGLYYKYDIDDIELFNSYIINLIEIDFDDKAINLYKNYNKLFKGDGGDAWACGILLENVNYYKDYVKSFMNDRIDKIFDNEYDRSHIERVMKGELKLLERSIETIKSKLKQLTNKEKDDKTKKSTEL